MSDARPKVSVCIVTYNQEKYIRECIQSVVDQETSFPFEVLVADDCSTDGTWEIVSDLQAKYPFVRTVRRAANLGPFGNARTLRKEARGEYLSHLDGDDHYLPGKLQIQADYLDANPDVAFVTHDVIKIDKAGNQVAASFSGPHPPVVDANYLLKNGCFFTNSSKMVRRRYHVFRDPKDAATVDFQGHLEEAINGKIAWLPLTLGAYRVSQGIASSPAWASAIDDAYDRAFWQAIQLGYNPKMVQSKRRIHFAIRAAKALRRRQARHFLDLLYRLPHPPVLDSQPRQKRRAVVGALLFAGTLPKVVLESARRRLSRWRRDAGGS